MVTSATKLLFVLFKFRGMRTIWWGCLAVALGLQVLRAVGFAGFALIALVGVVYAAGHVPFLKKVVVS